jgi:bacterioferritin
MPNAEPFKTDIEAIRTRAREKMMAGAVTDAYGADREQVVSVLNEVLATEIVCTLRYTHHALMADGMFGEIVKKEFEEHAAEERGHAEKVAERIRQLDGKPDMNPASLTARSHAEYREGDGLIGMIKENLVAERIAIHSYSEVARWLGERDPTTRRMIEEILEQEEEHADEMADLLQRLQKEQK